MKETASILNKAKDLQSAIVGWRRELHANPELSFKEVQTGRFVADALKSFGYHVREGVCKTGVIADFGNGPTVIAIRADMDALPLSEMNRAGYVSKNPGVMHACGHDANMACVLGAAQLLAKESLPGRIRILMQPGEEAADELGMRGSHAMIEAGALDGVAAVVGLHVDSTLASGKVAVSSGSIGALSSRFKLVIVPYEGSDGCNSRYDGPADLGPMQTIAIGARVVSLLDGIASRNAALSDKAKIDLDSFVAVPGSPKVTLQGNLSYEGASAQVDVIKEIEHVCSRLMTKDSPVKFHLSIESETADRFNSSRATSILEAAAVELVGADKVLKVKRNTWIDDFAAYTRFVPGAFMFLGVQLFQDRRSHHTASFDIDESSLHVGAAVLAETALRLFDEVRS